jgi:hypothetical protein
MHDAFRNALLIMALLAPVTTRAADLATFERHFVDATMRVDYVHTGDATEETATLDTVYKQGTWAGSRVHLVDPLEVGRSVVELRDPGSNALLFSKRFDTYFGEKRTGYTKPLKISHVTSYNHPYFPLFPLKRVFFHIISVIACHLLSRGFLV